jgi:hypothetical protein
VTSIVLSRAVIVAAYAAAAACDEMLAVIVATGPPLGPEIVRSMGSTPSKRSVMNLMTAKSTRSNFLTRFSMPLHGVPSLRLWIDFVQFDDQIVRDEISANARRHAAAIPDAQLVAVFEGWGLNG